MSTIIIDLALGFIKVIVYTYEIITLPVYFLLRERRDYVFYDSREALEGRPLDPRRHKILAMPTRKDDPSSPWRATENMDELYSKVDQYCELAYHLWLKPYSKYPDKHACGTRRTIKLEYETTPDGKKFIKAVMGKYQWETYHEAELRISKIAAGLYKIFGDKMENPMAIYSETRSEWWYTSQAIFRANSYVVTLYSTLGAEALIHGLNESQAVILFLSHELVGNVLKILEKCPTIRYIVYFSNGLFYYQDKEMDRIPDIFKQDIEKAKTKLGSSFMDIIDLEKIGEEEIEAYKKMPNKYEHKGYTGIWMHPKTTPQPDDLAFIMYTSGSTGTPKGVEITHRNLASAAGGFIHRLPEIYPYKDTLISYLPLAHVFELASELTCISTGLRVGYGSPQTLVDTSTRIKFGACKGDMTELCPTLFNFVPVVVERISKGVFEKLNDRSRFFSDLLKFAIVYRKRRMKAGYPGFLSHHLFLKNIKSVVGGNIRFVISGGAPLSEEAAWFVNIIFGQVIQGYGLTETTSCLAVMPKDDIRPNHIGAPVGSVEVKLREWIEGGYSPFDKPHPRGEIIVSGGPVTRGYHKQPELTAKEYFTDESGKRWFCTGDIGRFNVDGTLSIIDRKKDLVKLQAGEYVSLGKVELKLVQHEFVESICVYADSKHNFTIGFLSPKRKQLKDLAEKNNLMPKDETVEELMKTRKVDKATAIHNFLCENSQIQKMVLDELKRFARSKKLVSFEIPAKIHLDSLSWTPDTGLVTDALKLKRFSLKKRFEAVIEKFYS